MKIRRIAILLLFALAGPWTLRAQGRLETLTENLARASTAFSEESYRGFQGRRTGNRADVEVLYLVRQFDAGAQLLHQMVRDRRPASELRDAIAILSEQIRSSQRYAYGRRSWQDFSRTLEDASREVSSSGSQPDIILPGVSTGRLRWRGRVDNEVEIHIQRNEASPRVISGGMVANASSNFTAPLPAREVVVRLSKTKGRGSVEIVQQPSWSNDFTTVVRIRDSKSGASDYEFELTWQ